MVGFEIEQLLSVEYSFGNEAGTLSLGEFIPGQVPVKYLKDEARVLVIGAGGLGCEVLKSLAYSGFKYIDIIDMDTIDITNLNRQFLFRVHDVGKMKAEVAAEFMRRKKPDLKINSHTCSIQEKPREFYEQFKCIIAGLDNIKARRWINALVHEIVQFDEDGNIIPESVIPLIDGGTEGLKGQCRVIVPYLTACFECSLGMFQQNEKSNSYPLCTIADKPRKPEHCIMFPFLGVTGSIDKAKDIILEFQKRFGLGTIFNADNTDHSGFIYQKALQRSEVFGISGVTYSLTLGVIKNIIPAIAATNSAIAASCVLEAFKICTLAAPTLDNYFMLNGTVGAYTHTFKLDKSPGCPVCDAKELSVTVSSTLLLNDFIQTYLIQGECTGLKLEKPSLACPGKILYMQKPESLKRRTEVNLNCRLADLISSGDCITITDPLYPGDMRIDVTVYFL